MGSNMAEQHPVGLPVGDRGEGARGEGDPRRSPVHAHERDGGHARPDPRRAPTSRSSAGSSTTSSSTTPGSRSTSEHFTNGPVIIKPEFLDTDDASGFFSGWDPDHSAYAIESWGYNITEGETTAGKSEQQADVSGEQAHGAHGMKLEGGNPPRPRQLDGGRTLRAAACPPALRALHTRDGVRHLRLLAAPISSRSPRALCENSGRDRTSAVVYSVGWTQHTVGVQNIRAASIVQLLLGQHRPAGRRDPRPARPREHPGLDRHPDAVQHPAGLHPDAPPAVAPDARHVRRAERAGAPAPGGTCRPYIVSLLKAWWGDAATEDNDFCFDYLPRINGDHSHYAMMLKMLDGGREGHVLRRSEPHRRVGQLEADAPGPGQARLARGT